MDILTINDRIGEYPKSYYRASLEEPELYPEASGDVSADVCVVGGGYSGLSSALHLAKKGMSVVLIEANRIGSGASGRNGGQVSVGQRVGQRSLEKSFGFYKAKMLWDLSVEAVSLVRSLIREADNDCILTPGIISANHRTRFTQASLEYVYHLREKYHYNELRFLNQDAIREEIGSRDYCSGYLDSGSGHLHPLKYVFSLAKIARDQGVSIFEKTRMLDIEYGDIKKIKTDKAIIKSKYVVVGLNGYHNNVHRSLESKVMPINNFIAATEPLDKSTADTLIKNRYAIADSRFVINYFRLSEDNRLLFGGGESYGYQFPKDIKAKVKKPMLEVFPQLKDVSLDYAWGGTLGITMSRLPHFTHLQKDVISVSGFSGHGVALATLAGKLAAETVAGQASRFDMMSGLPNASFPGGALLRHPALVLGMLWYSLLDKI